MPTSFVLCIFVVNTVHVQLLCAAVVKGSKDEVELPRRKRVKEELEAEDVSTVTGGKVMVTAAGTARIIVAAAGEKTATSYKTATQTGTKSSVAKKDGALRKNKSSVKSADSSTTVSKKLKRTKQSDGNALTEGQQCDARPRPTFKSAKQPMPKQQPLKKKRRLV